MKSFLKKIIVKIIELEAKAVLKKYNPKIVAIIGSVGKTGTKDAVYTVLSKKFFVRKSEKSFNSDIGIPLTILGCPNGWYSISTWAKNIFEGLKLIFLTNHYPKWLVLEVGADRPGDIEKVASWVHPDVVVVTRFGDVPVHVEFFDSPEALIEEKKHLVKALKKDGLLILNYDDPRVMEMGKGISAKIITYGFGDGAKIQASNEKIFYKTKKGRHIPDGVSFKVNYVGSTVPVRIKGSFGKHQIYGALAGLSMGVAEDINMITVVEALGGYESPPGRLKLIEGINNSLILDDSYNSSPIALEGALEALSMIDIKEGGRKIVCLGDMLELGQFSSDEHKRLGGLVASVANELVAVGVRAKGFADGAHKNKMHKKHIHEYNDSSSASEFLKSFVAEGDLVLVKGSQSMRMEKIVEILMAEPENKGELLVRQEDVWKNI